MLFVATDSETTLRNVGENATGSFAASPHHPDNYIVSIGEQVRRNGQPYYMEAYDPEGKLPLPYFLKMALEGKQVLMVMHNAPFDFAYIVKQWPEETMEALPYLFLWDTQQVEYLLEGQSKVMPGLDWCAEQRDLPLKDNRLKEFWDAGIDTPDIPKDILLPYMEQDVSNTMEIFLDQWNRVEMSPKLLELVRIKMDDKLLSTFMEIYGMKFDLIKANEILTEVEAQQELVYNDIKGMVKGVFADDFEFNPASPEQVSTLLFGGDYKVERTEVVKDEEGNPVVYKSGKKKGEIKTRKTEVVLSTKGLKLKTKGVPKTKKGYSTNDETLSKLDHPIVAKLLELRGLIKDGSTYYKGYSALVWPDGMIRPSQNHEVAVTGRMSCSAPNLQNVSKEDEE